MDPAHLPHFALVLPLLLQGLSPLQNGLKGTVASPLCERALPAPSPLGHAWASHTSLPAVTCFPTHPSCKGRARPWLSSRLLPLTDTPLLTPPSLSPLPQAGSLLHSMLSPGFTLNPRLQCQLWYSNWQSPSFRMRMILPALISSAGSQALPYASNISSGESCGEKPAQKFPFLLRSPWYFHFSM